jgi:hypothetical protein
MILLLVRLDNAMQYTRRVDSARAFQFDIALIDRLTLHERGLQASAHLVLCELCEMELVRSGTTGGHCKTPAEGETKL